MCVLIVIDISSYSDRSYNMLALAIKPLKSMTKMSQYW